MKRFAITGLLCLLFGGSRAVLADGIPYSFTMLVGPGGYPTAGYPYYYSQDLGINDSGQVVGNAGSHGFVYSGGSFTTIDVPNAHQTNPTGINNVGQIVGWYLDASLGNHAFLYSGGNFTSFDYPNAVYTNAYGINDAGQIVGSYYDGSRVHGFLYIGGKFTSIDYPTAIFAELTGVNNTGQIVGNYSDSNTSIRRQGFLYSGGNFTTIDYPNAGNTYAYGINDSGQISGTSTANNVGTYGFLATPVRIDKTPPVISGMPAAGCTLWPPNHTLVQVATVTAMDALSGLAPGSFKVTGTSNEPIDPTNGSIVITPNGSGGFIVQLRADRLGDGTGRVYTLTAMAKDLAGNTATATATCTVPHDQGR